MRLYWEIGKRAFRRQLAYRTANLAGLATNCFFGYLRGAVLFAAFSAQPQLAGYDAWDALTYTWVTQGLIMVVALWGWWDVEATIRTGDVVSDLARPFSYLGYWLARDLGRALYFLLFRCLPVLLVGQVTMGLRWPTAPLTWLALAVSLALAVLASFGWRFIINLSAFWTTDARGLGTIALGVALFFGGFVVPARLFPDWLQAVAFALPFVTFVQLPADIFVERLTGPELLGALGIQALWAALLLAAAQALVGAATRRVVVQGG